MSSCLEIGAGKLRASLVRGTNGAFVVCVDKSYTKESCSHISDIERFHNQYILNPSGDLDADRILYNNLDIFAFLDAYKYRFHQIHAFRIFEHMFYDSGEIGRLLAALWSVAANGCDLTIVVPNALSIYDKILEFENKKTFKLSECERLKLLINTELQNTRTDPHGSTWTCRLARSYIEAEGTWIVDSIDPDFELEGRDIYMKIVCFKRI